MTDSENTFRRAVEESWRLLRAAPPRPPGSAAEAALGTRFHERLSGLGFLVQRQRFEAPPIWPLVLLTHVVAALVAALAGLLWPTLATILLALLAISLYGELTGRFHWLWPSLAKAEACNLIAQWQPEDATRTIVLATTLDSSRSGRLTNDETRRRLADFPLPLYPGWLPLGLIALLALGMLIRAFEGGGIWLALGLWTAGLALLFTALLLGEWAWGKTQSRARDNAVALALLSGLAQEIAETRPQDTEWCFLLLAAGQSGRAGAVHYLRELGGLHDPARTLVLSLDDLGGPLALVGREGCLGAQPYPEQTGLVLARQLTDLPLVTRLGQTDAAVFSRAGYPALTLTSLTADRLAPHLAATLLPDEPPDLAPARAVIRTLAAGAFTRPAKP